MREELKGSGSALHQVGDCLIASINSYSDENGITRAGKAILNSLNQDRAKGVIIDVSDVTILSTNEFSILKNLAKSIAMMGSIPIFVGFQPGVVASLVDFDTSFDAIITARNTDDAGLGSKVGHLYIEQHSYRSNQLIICKNISW